jgi:hypothetical protein
MKSVDRNPKAIYERTQKPLTKRNQQNQGMAIMNIPKTNIEIVPYFFCQPMANYSARAIKGSS